MTHMVQEKQRLAFQEISRLQKGIDIAKASYQRALGQLPSN